ELIIGSGMKAYYPSTSSYTYYAGEVEILDGKNKTDWPKYVDLSTYNYTRIYSTTSYSYFGSGIAVGDVNGDGLVDLALGGLGMDSKGAVYLFFNTGNLYDKLGGKYNKTDILNLHPDVTFYGPMGGSETGSNILIADVDGDQYDDLLIASGGYSTSQYSYAGRVDLYYGKDATQWVNEVDMYRNPGDYVITGSAGGAWLGGYSYFYDYYGMAVGWDSMAFGDFDVDGKLDFLLGEAGKDRNEGDAVMILYVKPTITIISAELVDGDGVAGNILTAGFKYYTFRVVLNDTWTWREVSLISLSFTLKGAYLGFIYTVEYRSINQSFFDTRNPFNYMTVSEGSSMTPSGYKKMTIEFKVMFSMDFLTDDFMDVTFLAQGGRSKAELTYEDYCRVEMDLTFTGSWVAYGEGGEFIPRGAFISGSQEIYFTGMRVVYEDTLVSPPNDFFDVRIVDNWHRVFFNYSSSGADFVIKARSYPISGELRFRIGIVNIIGRGKDVSVIPDYYFTVDADAPTAPKNVVIHSDSFTDLRGEYDNDGEIYVTWDPSYDLGCGIAGYYVKVRAWGSGTRGAAEGWIFTNETRIVLTNMTAGLNDVLVAAVDNVGNRGPVTTASVTIETDPISFYSGGPHQIWKTTDRVTVSIHLMDLGGSGVDLSSVEYCYSTSGLGNFGEWTSLGLYGSAQDTVVSVDLTLVDGKENYVKFRAKDIAGNGPFESDPINVWVDTKEVSFSNPTPPQSQMPLEEPYVVSTITITDTGSGVYGPSIYYSYSTGDLRHYTGWMSANIKIVNNTIVASTAPLLFEPGTTNYIKWRAKDVAGNGYTYSEDYPITIKPKVVNHKPIVVIKSPAMNSLYKTTDTITFSSEGTYDPDGDELKYSWYSADWELLSTEPTFSMKFPAGVHVVTLKVDDGEFNMSMAVTFTVMVAVEDLDIDHDGIPNRNDTDDDNDGWSDVKEAKMGTDPMNRDTDGDGVIDSRDYDPLNSAVWKEPEGKGRVNRLYVAIAVIVLLAMLSYAAFLGMAVKKGEEYKRKKLERQAAHLGEFVQRYEQLTGIEAPLLPKVKDLGVELLPAVVQDTLAGSALPSGPVAAPGAGAPEALPKAEEAVPAPEAVAPAPEGEVSVPPTEAPGAVPVPETVEQPPEGGVSTVECELCGTTIEVPPHEGPITVKCPLCGYEMTVQ
ncbi:MAG: FG-GAP repeat protein, partial [Thermoplasmata archaeon]|nr:FG-GAP repeat protein [Thermoplasmata archaeon]